MDKIFTEGWSFSMNCALPPSIKRREAENEREEKIEAPRLSLNKGLKPKGWPHGWATFPKIVNWASENLAMETESLV